MRFFDKLFKKTGPYSARGNCARCGLFDEELSLTNAAGYYCPKCIGECMQHA